MSRAISSSTMRRRPASGLWKTTSTLRNGTSCRAGSCHALVIRVFSQPAARTATQPISRRRAAPTALVRADGIGILAFEERPAPGGVRADEALVALEPPERGAAGA